MLFKIFLTFWLTPALLADGRLHTRVGGRITRRHDEVGRLARDFDRMAERIEALVAGQRRLR